MTRQGERLATIAEAAKLDRDETVRFLRVQAVIWRALAIIHAHHPELAKESMLRMALQGTLVGDIDRLEQIAERLKTQAQSCGETIGVFDPPHHFPKCTQKPDIWHEAIPLDCSKEP